MCSPSRHRSPVFKSLAFLLISSLHFLPLLLWPAACYIGRKWSILVRCTCSESWARGRRKKQNSLENGLAWLISILPIPSRLSQETRFTNGWIQTWLTLKFLSPSNGMSVTLICSMLGPLREDPVLGLWGERGVIRSAPRLTETMEAPLRQDYRMQKKRAK